MSFESKALMVLMMERGGGHFVPLVSLKSKKPNLDRVKPALSKSGLNDRAETVHACAKIRSFEPGSAVGAGAETASA